MESSQTDRSIKPRTMAATPNVDCTTGRLPMKTDEKQLTSATPESASKPQPPAHTVDIGSNTTANIGNNTSSSSGSREAVEGCEFAIAADLTLYANPLRCLRKSARPTAQHPHTADTAGGSDMIAADLVKYGSPLDDSPH